MTMCEICGENPAVMHVTSVINGERSEKHICLECAKNNNMGFPQTFDIGQLLSGFMQQEFGASTPPQTGGVKCQTCGMDYRKFRQGGLLGCADCYRAFAGHVEPLLNRVHGHVRHVGKVPSRTGGALKTQREIERLNAQLRTAIGLEQFEKAAELRDAIRALQAERKALEEKEGKE